MPKYIKDWLREDFKELSKFNQDVSMKYIFMRDDRRAVFHNFETIKSPADGIVLYVKVLDSPTNIVEVKGVEYTFEDYINNSLILSELVFPIYVIGIFMTYVDVHINRAPISGYLSYKEVNYISSYNYPMLFLEEDFLFEENFSLENTNYLYNNDRLINVFYNPYLKLKVYVMQIADYNIDTISSFYRENSFVSQSSRFSMIRYGSQVDVILPSVEFCKYEFLVSPKYHVLAGVDDLIKLEF